MGRHIYRFITHCLIYYSVGSIGNCFCKLMALSDTLGATLFDDIDESCTFEREEK